MKVFISYATSDLRPFRIPDIATRMENTEKIERVFYWDRDSTAQKSIVKYMEEAITDSDVILIFCTEASNNSGPVQQETDMAVYLNKRIVPIFQDINDVRISLRPKRGVKYYQDDFDSFFKELFMVVTEQLPEIPKEEEIAEFHGIPLVINEYRTMKNLEEQLGIIIPPIEPFCKGTKIMESLHLVARKSNKGNYGFSAENNHVIQFNFSREPNLDKLPPEINFFPEALSQLTYLRALNLGFQNITIIPAFIGKLTKLEYLDLRANNFKRFPKGLTNLKNLKVFLFSHDSNFPQNKTFFLITKSDYTALKSLITNGCALDLKAYRLRIVPDSTVLDEIYGEVFCENCRYGFQPRQEDIDKTNHIICPKCTSNRLFLFKLKEEE